MLPDSHLLKSLSAASFPLRPLRWLHLDLNSYFASVEQEMNPKWRGQPLIVAPMLSDTTCAIAASIEAKRLGIKTGTPVWEAKRRCSNLIIVPADHKHYVHYHEAIIAQVERHIPVHQVESIDEVACRLADNEGSEQHIRRLVAGIKAGIRKHVGSHLNCSVGVAPSRLLAKLGSDVQKPDGLVIYPAETLPAALFGLKLTDICGIGRNMERRLMLRNITSIAQFCALGPNRARRIWGSIEGQRLWYLLHGIDVPPVPTNTSSIGHSHVLPPAARAPAPARSTLRRLAVKAAARMRRAGYSSGEILLHVRFADDRSRWKGALRIPRAQDNSAILAGVDQLWQRMEAETRAAAKSPFYLQVGLMLLNLKLADDAQYGLFDADNSCDALPSRSLALSQAMDAVCEKMGRHAVTLGMDVRGKADVIGTKVAFARIPSILDLD
jgi:DNA polymerase IV